MVLAVPMTAFSQNSDTPGETSTLVTVNVDKASYTAGQTITVSGTISAVRGSSPELTIKIADTLGATAVVDQIGISDGMFKTTITTGPSFRTSGEYTVQAFYTGITAEATFDFFATEGAYTPPPPSAQRSGSESVPKPSSSGAPQSSTSPPPDKEPESGTEQESPASGAPDTTPSAVEQESAPGPETALSDIPPPPQSIQESIPAPVQEPPVSGAPSGVAPPPPPPPPPVQDQKSGLAAVPSAVPLPPVAAPIPAPVCAPGYELVDGRCELVRSGSGGCLIATAAYGTEMAGEVQMLREIRDNVLLTTGSGASFVSVFNGVYYTFSPAVADMELQSPEFQAVVRTVITPMIATLAIMSLADGGSEAGVVGLGMAVIALNLGMYVGVPVMVAVTVRRIVRRRSHSMRRQCSVI